MLVALAHHVYMWVLLYSVAYLVYRVLGTGIAGIFFVATLTFPRTAAILLYLLGELSPRTRIHTV